MARLTLSIYGIQDCSDSDVISFSHSHNITLMHNGKIIFTLPLERYTRRKHDNRLHAYLFEILKKHNVKLKDVDIVSVDNVLGRSFSSSNGKFRTEAPLNHSLQEGIEEGRGWLFDQPIKTYHLSHELAHVYANVPFFGEFKENSLLVHFDGGASCSNFSAWEYKHAKLRLLKCHWDLKKVTSLFNANALSFGIVGASAKDQHQVAGKLMGLAAYGKYDAKIAKWLQEHNYFANIWDSKQSYFNSANSLGETVSDLSTENKFNQNVIATMHQIWLDAFHNELETLVQQGQYDNLYLSGGCALNIVSNVKIVKNNWFNSVYIPPCCEDSGLSVGAAAALEIQKGNSVELHSPFLVSGNEEEVIISDGEIAKVARLVSKGEVVAICNGRAEVGPRALGNRSIIAAANSKNLAEKVSSYHKGREWFRPVAPIILEENLFYFTGSNPNNLSRLMLTEFTVLMEKRKEIEGVVHVDGSARFQTLGKGQGQDWMRNLLKALDEKYGMKALINTSFNKKGEPIVNTAEEAHESIKNLKINHLVINGIMQ